MEILNRSLQKTNTWIKDAGQALNWKDVHKSYTALRAVLHAVRDQLSNQEVVQLGAQLPTFLRGVYYEGWKLRSKPVQGRTNYAFLSAIQKPFGKDSATTLDTAHIARSILSVLNQKISEGEIDDIRAILPKGVDQFWPARPASKGARKVARKAKTKLVRRKEQHSVRELLQAANQTNRAVTGLASTLKGLNDGRAWRIFYDPKVPLHGYACSICGSMFAADRESCTYCGSTLHEVEDMATHIVEFAVEHKIKIDAVSGNESSLLTRSAGGIGAFLKTTRASKAGLA